MDKVSIIVAKIEEPIVGETAVGCGVHCDPEQVGRLAAGDALIGLGVRSLLSEKPVGVVAISTTVSCQGGGHFEGDGRFHCMAKAESTVRDLFGAKQNGPETQPTIGESGLPIV